MGNPVVYHGASNGNGPWPTSGYTPSASALTRTVWLPADVWAMNSGSGQDNPPRATWRNFGAGVGEWFLRCVAWPQAVTGGSWAQTSFYLPAGVDVSAGTLTFTLHWSIGNQAPGAVPTNWHMDFGGQDSGRVIAGSGPGTQVNQLGATNEYLYCGPFTMQPTRAAAGEALIADRAYHLNVYRGATGGLGVYTAYFFGVSFSYQMIA